MVRMDDDEYFQVMLIEERIKYRDILLCLIFASATFVGALALRSWVLLFLFFVLMALAKVGSKMKDIDDQEVAEYERKKQMPDM